MALQDDINNFGAGCTAADLINLAAQTSCTTTNRILAVDSVNDLPDLSTESIPIGTVIFVNSLNIPVIAQYGCWTGLDNRELRSDFNLAQAFATGCGSVGILGDNTTANKSSPVNVIGGISNWCQIATGCDHTVGLTLDGVAWSWGRNSVYGTNGGKLGDGTNTDRSSPVQVTGGFSWCQISAGGVHSLGIRNNGTLWSWGSNGSTGILGLNAFATPTCVSSPVQVCGGFTDWCQISAGLSHHSLAVRTNGCAYAWGCSACGQLGNNSAFTNRYSPFPIYGNLSNWCQVSAGCRHSLGVTTDGAAWAWGFNSAGILGDNTAINRSSPVSVAGGFTDWCRVAAGRRSSLGLRCDGTLWAWGCNQFGEAGDGTTTDRSSPVSVVGGFTNWCKIGSGGYHNAGVRTNGTAWAWGYGGQGRLGTNNTISRSSPVSVVGGSEWSDISAGHSWSTLLKFA